MHTPGGRATEVVAVPPEGIVMSKQVLGEPLPQGDAMSELLPPGLPRRDSCDIIVGYRNEPVVPLFSTGE